MIFQVPVRKIEKPKAAIRAVLNCQSVPVWDIARIAGYIISMTIALGPIARFFTRHMYFVIAFRRSWRDYVYVSEHLSHELKFGLQRVDAFNGYHTKRKFCATAVVYSDASDSGFGGFSSLVGDRISYGHWNQFEASQSSTCRELKALLYVLQSFSAALSHRKVKWFSDSQNTCRIVSVGGSRPELQAIAVEIFEVRMSFDIAMEIEWLPRSQNDRADYLSRIVDLDDWSLSAALFQLVDSSWGPHTVDSSASFYNP